MCIVSLFVTISLVLCQYLELGETDAECDLLHVICLMDQLLNIIHIYKSHGYLIIIYIIQSLKKTPRVKMFMQF